MTEFWSRFRRVPFARKRTAHLRFGRRGERLAARLLKDRGLDILCRNYDAPHGEIDIVARDGDVLCFVEVKSRRPSLRTRPADAVTLKKRARVVRAARNYLKQLNNPAIACRYDIVEVVMDGRRLLDIRHWPDEFTGDDVMHRLYAVRRDRVFGDHLVRPAADDGADEESPQYARN